MSFQRQMTVGGIDDLYEVIIPKVNLHKDLAKIYAIFKSEKNTFQEFYVFQPSLEEDLTSQAYQYLQNFLENPTQIDNV